MTSKDQPVFLTACLRRVRTALAEPRLEGVAIDDPVIIEKHREILEEKRSMKEVFSEFYDLCWTLDQEHLRGDGRRVEIGAGSSFFKKQHPSILSSDLKPAVHLDMVVDALSMPFDDGSIRSYHCINCFHHFPDPRQFFRELDRTLTVGGGAVLIEPFFGAFANRFYQHVFDVEHFNKAQDRWTEGGAGNPEFPGANQALSYVVFFRDRDLFTREFPGLEIAFTRPIGSYLRYLLSGGLNFRQLVPDVAIPLVRGLERVLLPLRGLLALHHVIVLRKKAVV